MSCQKPRYQHGNDKKKRWGGVGEETYHGIISQVGTGLVGAAGRRGALPARHIDGVEVLGHLGDHDGVQTAVGGAGLAAGEAALEDVPKLLALGVGRVLDGQVAALGHDGFSRVGALCLAPAVVGPPLLDRRHLRLERSFFRFKRHFRVRLSTCLMLVFGVACGGGGGVYIGADEPKKKVGQEEREKRGEAKREQGM